MLDTTGVTILILPATALLLAAAGPDPILFDLPARVEAPADAPRPSDPWSALREAPGVVLDRVDVGGSETGQQSLLVSRGDGGTGATWQVDGLEVTDPAAPGFSALYLGTAMAQAVEVRTGTLDARQRTAGAHVRLELPSPADRRRGSAFVRLGGPPFQWDNRSAALKSQGLLRTETRRLAELALEGGGPVAGDRLSLWGGATYSRLRQETFTEHGDVLQVTSLALRGRIRAGAGHLGLMVVAGEKVQTERDTGFSTTRDARWRQSGPGVAAGLFHDHALRPGLRLRSTVNVLDAGFRLEPRGGADAGAFEDRRGVLQGSYYRFETERRRYEARAELLASFRRSGGEHRLEAGLEYRLSPVTTRAEWPGDKVFAIERDEVFFRAFRLTGFAIAMRDQAVRTRNEGAALFVQDTFRRGRWLATAGLRGEIQRGRALSATIGGNPVFPDELPPVSFPGSPPRFEWVDLLPRAGVSWDVSPAGGWRAQATYAQYAAPLGAGEVTYDVPGREFASVTYYWIDRNGDRAVDAGELDDLRGRIGASGVDPENPAAATSPHAIDPDLRSPRTHEWTTSLEGRRDRSSLTLTTYFRRTTDVLWRPLQNLTLADYVARGAASGQLFGEDYAVVYYAPASESRIAPGQGRVLTNRGGYHQDVVGVELRAQRRFGPVDAAAWASLSDWRERFPDRSQAVQDPTPVDGEPLRDLGTVAVRSTGLGRDVFVNALWSGGARIAAALPAGLRLAGRLHARQGFPIPYVQVVGTGDPTAGAKAVLVSPNLDTYRLPGLALLDLRLDRAFAIGSGGRLHLGLEAFNALNSAATLQAARDVELPAFPRAREIVRPRVLAVVARYTF